MYEIRKSRAYITKDLLLSNLTEEQIFERYLGIEVRIGLKVCNPLRDDHKPTCDFYYNKNNRLYFKDHAGYFHGDCFNLVMNLHKCTYTESFYIIARDFNLINNDNTTSSSLILSANKTTEKKTKLRAEICVQRQAWQSEDIVYWKSFYLNSKILAHFNVASCKYVWLNGEIIYKYHPKDPAYVYYFDETGTYKIYFPNRKEYRFINNSTDIQGWKQLPESGDNVIITKSLKDIMVLYKFGISSVAPHAEGHHVAFDSIINLRSRFKNLYSLYDFDKAGRTGAFKLYYGYGIPYLFLTNGRFRTRDYGAKDISDYIKAFGEEKTLELIKDTYNLIV